MFTQTLRGQVRKRTHVRGLPAHPIEKDPSFKLYLAQVGAEDSTRYALTRMLRTLIPCTLAELTDNNIEHAVQKLIADGYKLTSVDRYLRILKAYLSYANSRGFVAKNAAIDVLPPDSNGERRPTAPVTITNEHRDAIDAYYKASTAEDQFFWACIKTGARIHEPVMATAGDIEILTNKNEQVAYVWLGSKNHKKGKRKVDLPAWVTPAIISLLEAAQGNPDYPLMYLKGVPIVFPRRGGPPTTMRHRTLMARNAFYAVQIKLFGEKLANPHAFRHDYTTRVLVEHPTAFMVEKLAERNGHKPETLRENYRHLLDHGPSIRDV